MGERWNNFREKFNDWWDTGLIGQSIDAFTGRSISKIEEQNFNLEKEKYEYDKQLQQTIFDREDSAVTRRTADLENAGLSPTLAAGSAAHAGSPISTTAPQRHTRGLEVTQGKMQQMVGLASAAADISKTLAETALVNKQTRQADLNYQISGAELKAKLYQNEITGETLYKEMDRIRSNANRAEWERQTAEWESYAARLDFEQSRALQDYIEHTYPDPTRADMYQSEYGAKTQEYLRGIALTKLAEMDAGMRPWIQGAGVATNILGTFMPILKLLMGK